MMRLNDLLLFSFSMFHILVAAYREAAADGWHKAASSVSEGADDCSLS